MNRRKEREFVLKVLYSLEYNPLSWESGISSHEENFGEFATQFAREMIEKCSTKVEQLDEEIRAKLINWEFNRVASIDIILIRMALCEFICFEDIPPEVTINEIVDISKKFSTPKSGKFINGILDSLVKDMKKNKRLKKSGRGLVSKVIGSDSVNGERAKSDKNKHK
jgi:N utilization substance protein B